MNIESFENRFKVHRSLNTYRLKHMHVGIFMYSNCMCIAHNSYEIPIIFWHCKSVIFKILSSLLPSVSTISIYKFFDVILALY